MNRADAFFFGTPLQMSRVIGGPAWIDSDLYEINAQASAPWQRPPDGVVIVDSTEQPTPD